MQRRAHAAFSAMLGVLVAKLLAGTVSGVYVGLVVAIVAGVFPDLDLGYRHRAALHNLFACLLLGSLAYYAGSLYSLGLGVLVGASFIAGFLGHLFLDALTVRGVALLYPFSKKYYRFARLRSNNRLANMVIEVLSLLALIAIFVSPLGW